MSDKLDIDTDAIAELVAKEAKTAYGGMWKDLRKEQQDLFERITKDISVEYMAYAFGPAAEKAVHGENLKSLRNALAALEGIAAIKTYRTTIHLVGRILAALIKSTAAAAIGL
jgi:hypothetical protein